MLKAANAVPGCVAVNTLGFTKHCVVLPLKSTPWICGPGTGLYIRKEYFEQLQRSWSGKTRVKFLTNWCSSEELVRRWSRMTQGDGRWNDLVMTADDTDVNYWVILNYPQTGATYDPARTIVFQMEPRCSDPTQSWGTKTWGEWANPDPAKFLAVCTHEHAVNLAEWQLPQDYQTLKTLDATTAKARGNVIGSICSSKYVDPGHKKRIDFLKFVEAAADPDVQVDIFGRENTHGFASYKGALGDAEKDKGILPYKYYFMCENNAERNYITEKLWEPILMESLCFYWGAPNVTEVVDPQVVVVLDMNDFAAAFATIKRAIQEDWWSQRLPAIRKEKARILETMTVMPTVERILREKQKLA